MRQLNKKMCGEYIQYPEKVLQFGKGSINTDARSWAMIMRIRNKY